MTNACTVTVLLISVYFDLQWTGVELIRKDPALLRLSWKLQMHFIHFPQKAELVHACHVRYNSILDTIPELHVSSGGCWRLLGFAQGWEHAGDSLLSLWQFAEETHVEAWLAMTFCLILKCIAQWQYHRRFRDFTIFHLQAVVQTCLPAVPQSAAVQDSTDFGILCQCRFNCPSVTWRSTTWTCWHVASERLCVRNEKWACCWWTCCCH